MESSSGKVLPTACCLLCLCMCTVFFSLVLFFFCLFFRIKSSSIMAANHPQMELTKTTIQRCSSFSCVCVIMWACIWHESLKFDGDRCPQQLKLEVIYTNLAHSYTLYIPFSICLAHSAFPETVHMCLVNLCCGGVYRTNCTSVANCFIDHGSHSSIQFVWKVWRG